MDALIRSFNAMVRELDGIELFRTDFINNFSHEFKTPIVSIRGFARELQRADITEECRREYAEIIAEEADRLTHLSSSILDLTRLEHQEIVTDRSCFYLDEQIRRILLSFEPEWGKKNQEILPELETLLFYSNEEILSHVWRNLIANAIKFTPVEGRISVQMHVEPEKVTVVVEDNGIGMSAEVASRVFERFYQGDSSHHRAGYGIGLATVHRAVTLLGGEVRVESREGEGSRFTVLLPRLPLPETEEQKK